METQETLILWLLDLVNSDSINFEFCPFDQLETTDLLKRSIYRPNEVPLSSLNRGNCALFYEIFIASKKSSLLFKRQAFQE